MLFIQERKQRRAVSEGLLVLARRPAEAHEPLQDERVLGILLVEPLVNHQPQTRAVQPNRTTGADGTCTFNLPGGKSYKFRIAHNGYEYWSAASAPFLTVPLQVPVDTTVVVTKDGQPLEGYVVYAFAADGTYQNQSKATGSDGRCAFNLPVGQDYKFRTTYEEGEYWSGNVAGGGTAVIAISSQSDYTPPTTTTDYQASGQWTNGDVLITFTATDGDAGSGVAVTYVAINGGEPFSTTQLSLTEDGVYSIEFWSEDVEGNSESPQSIEVKIDQTSPTLTLEPDDDATIKTASFSISATWSDALAGVDPAFVRLFVDSDEVTADAVFSEGSLSYDAVDLPDGFHTLILDVMDTVGNYSAAVSVVVVQTDDGDLDGDGWSNRIEELMGTDPRDAGSCPGSSEVQYGTIGISGSLVESSVQAPGGPTYTVGGVMPLMPEKFVPTGGGVLVHPWYTVHRQEHGDEEWVIGWFSDGSIHGGPAAGDATFYFPFSHLDSEPAGSYFSGGPDWMAYLIEHGPTVVTDVQLGNLNPPGYTYTLHGYSADLRWPARALKTNLDMTVTGVLTSGPSLRQTAPEMMELPPEDGVASITLTLNSDGRVPPCPRTITIVSSSAAVVKFRNPSDGGVVSGDGGAVEWWTQATSVTVEAVRGENPGGSCSLVASVDDIGDPADPRAEACSEWFFPEGTMTLNPQPVPALFVPVEGSSERIEVPLIGPPTVTIISARCNCYTGGTPEAPVEEMQVVIEGRLSPSWNVAGAGRALVPTIAFPGNDAQVTPIAAAIVRVEPQNGTFYVVYRYYTWSGARQLNYGIKCNVSVQYTSSAGVATASKVLKTRGHSREDEQNWD